MDWACAQEDCLLFKHETLSSNPSPTKKRKRERERERERSLARCQWLTSIILATWEAESRRIKV
jgi:hypothetical protein